MFRFTIRDVLWLTVVVGLATGWVVDHHHSQTSHLDSMMTWVLESEGWTITENSGEIVIEHKNGKLYGFDPKGGEHGGSLNYKGLHPKKIDEAMKQIKQRQAANGDSN